MALKEETKNIILAHIKEVLTSNYNVFLFGSYAKGKETKTSDIDIAIKSNKPLPPAQWSMIEEKLEESSITQKIDVVDYHRVKDDFKKIIDKEGIKLN